MTRPYDWDPLATQDPVPGDVRAILVQATRYRDTADLLRTQAARVRRLAADRGHRSDAWERFQEKAPEVADRMDRAVRRYEETAQALRTYGGALDRAQVRADGALRRAKEAATRLRQAEALLAVAPVDPAAGPGTPADPTTRRALAGIDDAATDLGAARNDLLAAIGERDAAAATAVAAIHDVSNHDGLKDSRWDKIKGWVKDRADVIEKVADIAGVVAAAAGMAALAVGWIPIAGQGLAAGLGATALTLTAVSLGAHAVLAATGNGGWANVGVDVVALATFGLGRAFALGARTSYTGARASARMEAYAQVRAASPGISNNAAYHRVNALTGGQAGAATARIGTVEAAGTTARPSTREFAESFRPGALRQETADAISTSRAAGEAAQGAGATRLNPVIAAERGPALRVDDGLKADANYGRLMQQGDLQAWGWFASTATATALDASDLHHEFDRFDAATRWAP